MAARDHRSAIAEARGLLRSSRAPPADFRGSRRFGQCHDPGAPPMGLLMVVRLGGKKGGNGGGGSKGNRGGSAVDNSLMRAAGGPGLGNFFPIVMLVRPH